MNLDDIRSPSSHENLPTPRLKKVLSDLKSAIDIDEVLLIGEKEGILVYAPTENENFEAEIPKIFAHLRGWGANTPSKPGNNMFAHHILDYNGSKIVAVKCVNDLMLVIILQKQGYIGPAMLELENSVREIGRILNHKRLRHTEPEAQKHGLKPLISNRNPDNTIFDKKPT